MHQLYWITVCVFFVKLNNYHIGDCEPIQQTRKSITPNLNHKQKDSQLDALMLRLYHGRQTMLAKLHDEKDKESSDPSSTRLAASGDSKEASTLGDASGYWGDIGGEDFTSNMDHNLDDAKGEAEQSGVSGDTKGKIAAESPKQQEKGFTKAVRGALKGLDTARGKSAFLSIKRRRVGKITDKNSQHRLYTFDLSQAEKDDMVGPYITSIQDIIKPLTFAGDKGNKESDYEINESSGSGHRLTSGGGLDKTIAHEILSKLKHEETHETAIKGEKIKLKHKTKVSNNTLKYFPFMYRAAPVLKYAYIPISMAWQKGAKCLDGSLPAYFYRRGHGAGTHKWILYLQGGAWCDSAENCYHRSKTNLGSSRNYKHLMDAGGILSDKMHENKHFHSWNVVYVPYCDGASFTGNRSDPVVVKGQRLYMRGKRILSALIDDLLVKGLQNATDVVFTGTSAGALAVLMNADYVKQRLPASTSMVALSDSGVFLNEPDLKGVKKFGKSMKRVYELHDSADSINPKCARKKAAKDRWECMFPAEFVRSIETPVYMVNPLYDAWQLANVVGVRCVYSPESCDKHEMKVIREFRKKTLNALEPILRNKNHKVFGDGCIDHGQVIFDKKWNEIKVNKQAMHEAFHEWHQDVKGIKDLIDPEAKETDTYPFNPTCWSHYHGKRDSVPFVWADV